MEYIGLGLLVVAMALGALGLGAHAHGKRFHLPEQSMERRTKFLQLAGATAALGVAVPLGSQFIPRSGNKGDQPPANITVSPPHVTINMPPQPDRSAPAQALPAELFVDAPARSRGQPARSPIVARRVANPEREIEVLYRCRGPASARLEMAKLCGGFADARGTPPPEVESLRTGSRDLTDGAERPSEVQPTESNDAAPQ
jgi:hypothetical protein